MSCSLRFLASSDPHHALNSSTNACQAGSGVRKSSRRSRFVLQWLSYNVFMRLPSRAARSHKTAPRDSCAPVSSAFAGDPGLGRGGMRCACFGAMSPFDMEADAASKREARRRATWDPGLARGAPFYSLFDKKIAWLIRLDSTRRPCHLRGRSGILKVLGSL